MQARWIADRAMLQKLIQQHPDWTRAARWRTGLVDQKGGSRNGSNPCVKPRQGMKASCLASQSDAKRRTRKRIRRCEERILASRDAPPENLQRTPGPRAILYYLPRDPQLHHRTAPLPRSTRTIWKILPRNDRITHHGCRKRKPIERPQPLEEVQMDFKDVSSVPADPAGKQQHVVEVFNFVDAGTSILLDAPVQADFHAQTALEAVIRFLQQ